jgi:hypothetical protein
MSPKGRIVPSPRSKEKVTAALKLVTDLRKSGGMEDDIYHKCLVCLAQEYSALDDMSSANYLISKVPHEYYETVQLKQMEEDKSYEEVVILLAYSLIQHGYVDGVDDVFRPTQTGATC